MAPAEPISTSTPSSASRTASATAGGRVRDTTIRGSRARRAAAATVGVASVTPCAGSATAPAISSPDCHSATCTAQSSRPSRRTPGCRRAGRRSTPVGGQPRRLASRPAPSSDSTASSGPLGGQRRHQEVVGALVPRGLSFVGGRLGELGAHTEQQLARLSGQACGELVVARLTCYLLRALIASRRAAR